MNNGKCSLPINFRSMQTPITYFSLTPFLAQDCKYNELEIELDELMIIHVHKVKSAHNKDTYLKVCELITYGSLE